MICPLKNFKNIIKAYEGEVRLLEQQIMECESIMILEDLKNKLNISRSILKSLKDM